MLHLKAHTDMQQCTMHPTYRHVGHKYTHTHTQRLTSFMRINKNEVFQCRTWRSLHWHVNLQRGSKSIFRNECHISQFKEIVKSMRNDDNGQFK